MAVLIIPARSSHTHGQAVGDEFVVLNHATKAVHHLEGAAAAVWAAAGSRIDATVDIRAAVDQLCLLDLLEAPAGVSRRSMLKRTGVIAAGVGIASVALPVADAAASFNSGTPSITVSPISGPRGTVVTVTGSNFATTGSQAVQSVTIGGITVTPSNTTITGTGTFSFTFVVPSNAPLGLDTVTVTDNHNNTASNSFTVTTPTVTLSRTAFPKSGSPSSFTVTASSGFLPGSTITITNTGVDTFGVTPSTGIPVQVGGNINTATSFAVTYGNGNRSGQLTFTDGAGNTASVNVSA